MRLRAVDRDGRPVLVDVDHDAIRASLTVDVVDDLQAFGPERMVTFVVPARLIGDQPRR